ncbi:MAG TPA: PTS sugar transporter subunit IIA [Opitutaceae bacterium]|nr:PTS sugar transporter subunit IIA [Opitutaceae bacterium]
MRSILTALQEGRLFELPEGAAKERVLGFLARILDANPNIEAGMDVVDEITLREKECNTGIGLGVAVPHVRGKREEGELYCAIGWASQGIAWDAADANPVHLAVMYYIPGAQKNVYLKEVSSLVKAIRKSGGIEPIARATDLNAVRNLLLDWVSSVLGDAGPEAVARMIKLEMRHAQAAEVASAPPAAEPAAEMGGFAPVPAPDIRGGRAAAFSVLVAPPNNPFVLATDAECVETIEREEGLAQRLAAGAPFSAGGTQIFVTGSTAYSAGRVLYNCVAILDKTPSSDLSKS